MTETDFCCTPIIQILALKGPETKVSCHLKMCREREILLVELQLLVPGEPLPWGGVSEGWEPELLILQLLGDGQPLARAQT